MCRAGRSPPLQAAVGVTHPSAALITASTFLPQSHQSPRFSPSAPVLRRGGSRQPTFPACVQAVRLEPSVFVGTLNELPALWARNTNVFRDDELLSIAKPLGPPCGAPKIADIIYIKMDGEHVRSHRARPSPGILARRGCRLKTNMNNATTPVVLIVCFSRTVFPHVSAVAVDTMITGTSRNHHRPLNLPHRSFRRPRWQLYIPTPPLFFFIIFFSFIFFFFAYSASVYTTHIKPSTRD